MIHLFLYLGHPGKALCLSIIVPCVILRFCAITSFTLNHLIDIAPVAVTETFKYLIAFSHGQFIVFCLALREMFLFFYIHAIQASELPHFDFESKTNGFDQ